MSGPIDDPASPQVPWLPDERFELALDDRRGVVTSTEAGENLLTVTTHRAILRRSEPGKRTIALLPLGRLTAIEVVDIHRAAERLPQGLVLLGVGALIAWVSWVVVGVMVISLLIGGLPVLAAIYILTGYAFPDQDGALVLHADSFSMRHPLRTESARKDAYLVAHRLSELASLNGGAPAPPAEEPAPATAAAPGAPGWPAAAAAAAEATEAEPPAEDVAPASGDAAFADGAPEETEAPAAEATEAKPLAEDPVPASMGAPVADGAPEETEAPAAEATEAEPSLGESVPEEPAEEEQAPSERGTTAPPAV